MGRVSSLVGETLGTGSDPLPGLVVPVEASPQLAFAPAGTSHSGEGDAVREDDVEALVDPLLPPPPPGPPSRGAIRFMEAAAPGLGPLARGATWGVILKFPRYVPAAPSSAFVFLCLVVMAALPSRARSSILCA